MGGAECEAVGEGGHGYFGTARGEDRGWVLCRPDVKGCVALGILVHDAGLYCGLAFDVCVLCECGGRLKWGYPLGKRHHVVKSLLSLWTNQDRDSADLHVAFTQTLTSILMLLVIAKDVFIRNLLGQYCECRGPSFELI